MRCGVGVVEHRDRIGSIHRQDVLTEFQRHGVGLGRHVVELGGLHAVLAHQQRLHALDGVAMLPDLDFGVDAVARWVVRRRVRAHAVGVGLDQRRAPAHARALERALRDFVDREDVVAVDANAGEAETGRAVVEGNLRLNGHRRRDAPLVVLTEEDDGRIER